MSENPIKYIDACIANMDKVITLQMKNLEINLATSFENNIDNMIKMLREERTQQIKQHSEDCMARSEWRDVKTFVNGVKLRNKYPLMLSKKQLIGIVSGFISIVVSMNIFSEVVRRWLGLP